MQYGYRSFIVADVALLLFLKEQARDLWKHGMKLVSRGNYIEDTIRDIKALRTALTILEHADYEAQYVDNMKKALFPCGKCSGNCYYGTVQTLGVGKRTKTADHISRTAMDSEWEFPNMLPKAF